MILTAELRFDGGYSVKRVATDFYYSKTTDADGLQEFSGRITGVPTFSTRVGCIIWGNRTSSSIGSLEVANTDFGVTDWIYLRARDCECILKVLNYGDSYDSAAVVARCIIDSVEMEESVVRINLRGKDTLLDKPLQPLLYSAAQASEATSIEGQPIPIAIGALIQVEPVLTDVNDLIYAVGDSYYKSLDEVRSGGSLANSPTESPDDYAYTDTGFRMLNTPSARITATLTGNRRPQVVIASNLFLASAWTGSVPTGWTRYAGGTVAFEAGIGGRFVNQSPPLEFISYPADQGSWYYVVGELLSVDSGGISIDFGTSRTEYMRTGRFCAVGLIESGVGILISAVDDDTHVTIGYLHVYKMVNGTDSSEFRYTLENICARAGLRISGSAPEGDVTPSNPAEYSIGLFARDSISARDALQTVMDSVSGWFYTDSGGMIKFGKYDLPSVAPAILSVSKLNLLTYPVFKPDLAPGLSTRIGGGKNWSPYTEDELAGITFPNRPPFMVEFRYVRTGTVAGRQRLAPSYSHALSAAPIKTTIATSIDTQTEADRIAAIVVQDRGFWEFDVVLESVASLSDMRPDTMVLLDDPVFGADEGKKARIVGIDGQYDNPVLKVICWGAT